MPASHPRDLGEGPLGRVTGTVYWFLVVGLLQVLTTLPGTVPLLFLDRSPGNAPLVALCLLPVAPALSAGLFALRRRRDAEALQPAAAFWRGYRLGAADVIKLWAPALVLLTLLGINLAYLDATGVPAGYVGVAVVLGALALTWVLLAMVIATVYSFRTRDTARLAIYYLLRRPVVTLGVLGTVLLAGAVVLAASDAVLALLGWAFTWLLLRVTAPIVQDVGANYVTTDVNPPEEAQR